LSPVWVSYVGLHLYFVSESGVTWRTSLLHRPYFYLSVKRNSLRGETASTYLLQLQEAIKDHLERVDVQIEEAYREDLSDPAHLARLLPSWDFDSSETAESFAKKRFASAAGKEAQDRKDDAKMPSRRLFLKLSFSNVKSLVEARDELRKIVRRNREVHQRRQEEERRMGGYIGEKKKKSFYSSSSLTDGFSSSSRSALEGASRTSGKHLGGGGNEEEDDEEGDVLELIDDLFEADVLYIARCCIDLKLRCGLWHDVKKSSVSMADPLE
ncbi:dna polymerase family b protein, partial [Cystoisospora suis]